MTLPTIFALMDLVIEIHTWCSFSRLPQLRLLDFLKNHHFGPVFLDLDMVRPPIFGIMHSSYFWWNPSMIRSIFHAHAFAERGVGSCRFHPIYNIYWYTAVLWIRKLLAHPECAWSSALNAKTGRDVSFFPTSILWPHLLQFSYFPHWI